MTRSPACRHGRRARSSLSAVLSIGLILVLSAPASAGRPETPAPPEVDQVEALPGTLESLDEPGLVVPSGVFLNETEPNNTSATAQPLPSTPARVRATLYRAPFVTGNEDVDVFSFVAPAGARVYAATMTGWSGGSQDTEIDILDVDGTTVIETDDDNGTVGTLASSIGGTLLTTGGTYYVRLRQSSVVSLTGTIRPYDLYVTVVTGTPTAETEPNNNGQPPNPIPAPGWISGTVDPVADTDTFSFTANAGDTIVVIQDLDPERDTPDWNGRVGIGLFNGFFLVTGDTPPAADLEPAEALMMEAKNTGTYVILVDAQVAGVGGPAATYNFAVFVIPGRTRTCTTYAGTGGAIADLATTDFTVSVPDVKTVDYMRVSVNATHPDSADLDVTLISPDGNEVILFDDPGTTAAAAPPQIDVTLEDEGAIPMSTFAIHSSMRYAPEQGGRFQFFQGMQAQGNWTMRVRDDLTGDTGTINSWSIEICEAAPPAACQTPGPQEVTILATDFESGDAGFTHSGTLDEWERGMPTFDPLLTTHSGVNAWKTDLDSTYENSANYNLRSPLLDLTTAAGRVTLSWWQEYQMESASFDSYWVEVRRAGNPASGRRLFEWTGSTMTRTVGNPSVTIRQSHGWALMQADISDFAGTVAEVVYHIDTDSSVQHTGIAVDDVRASACPVVTGSQIADVGITNSDGQGTYFPGEELTYTVVASNAGPAAVAGARVKDFFPAELTNVSWTCSASSGSTCGSASGTGDIDVPVNLLAAGTATFTVTATVDAGATDPIVTVAAITVPAGFGDPVTSNNAATDTDVLATAEPRALDVDTAGNRVYEPNETVVVAPTWMNTSTAAFALTGGLANHTGPPGPTYTIPDGSADYGTIGPNNQASCTVTGNCYSVSNTVTNRPVLHWDSTAEEGLSTTGDIKTWTLHIGNSFADVSMTGTFYRFIEILLHQEITGGCSAANYCPGTATLREQMAVFVLIAKEGPGYTPPACVPPNLFSDVPETSPFCRFIEELAERQVVAGCDVNLYCPKNPVTREQMAVFVLRTLDPQLNPPACVSGSERFNDMPASNPFCRWVEELARRGVVGGCQVNPPLYCPTDPVTREQMGVFLTVTFGLTLYGV